MPEVSQTERITSIRWVAVRETSDSRHYGGPNYCGPPCNHMESSQYYSIEMFKGGGSIGPLLCGETLVSGTADVFFFNAGIYI